MDSWSGSDWNCSLLSFKSPLSFCKQKSAWWSEQKGGISIFIRCWLQDFFSPPLSPSPSPSPWMNLETQTHRVAWLAGFILFSGLIWPEWSVFQIAEEDSVTERPPWSCRKLLQKEHLSNRASGSEKEHRGSLLSLALDPSKCCRSDELGLCVRTPGLILIGLGVCCWSGQAKRPWDLQVPSVWRKAAVVHFQCVGLKV